MIQKVRPLSRASRSKFVNRPISAGLDGRSREGRYIRDLTAELLLPFGGTDAPVAACVKARAVARAQLQLMKLEALDAVTEADVITRSSEYAAVLKELGVALRRLETSLESEPHTNQREADPVRDYLKNKQAAEVVA